MPSAANPRPRYNVPVTFMSSGVVDPYEVDKAVIEPPRQPAVADQPSLRPSMTDLPSTQAGLGAEPSSIAMHLEEGLKSAGEYHQLLADLPPRYLIADISCASLQLSADDTSRDLLQPIVQAA